MQGLVGKVSVSRMLLNTNMPGPTQGWPASLKLLGGALWPNRENGKLPNLLLLTFGHDFLRVYARPKWTPPKTFLVKFYTRMTPWEVAIPEN